MKVLVCGSRFCSDYSSMAEVLNWFSKHYCQVTEIIHGGCTGADALAGKYALDNNIPCRVFPANWDLHGRAAGPIRNQRMIDEGKPDMVLVMPGGAGTKDMMNKAFSAGVMMFYIGTQEDDTD